MWKNTAVMDMLRRLPRLLRTLRYVPPQALAWRVWARIKRVYYQSPFYGILALQDDVNRGGLTLNWVGVELVKGHRAAGECVARGQFELAGSVVELGLPVKTWLPPRVGALGLFTLHYHEWLADLRAADKLHEARELMADWMMAFGHYDPLVWHPYPTSLRIVAWLTHGGWLLEGAEREFAEAFGDLLQRQVRYVADNCEWDLGGNHLLKNLKAMVYGGLAVEGLRPVYERGFAEFLRQLQLQVLDDGAHYELSPLYQAQVLRDVLDVRAVLRKLGGAPAVLDGVARKLGTALAFYCHNDGGLALFNDSAALDADYVGQLLRLSGADEPPVLLENAGYARLQRGGTVVLLDAGRVGPDENPGHAHADTLSFEMSLGRERVIVNCGTHGYQDRLRNSLRGTPAHSTVSVDGRDSAEVWGSFRVGRRPRRVTLALSNAFSKVTEAGTGSDIGVEGAHDGYRHLGVYHSRRVLLAGDGSRLRGEDEVTFRRPWKARVTAHFHLHPDVEVRLLNEAMAELTLPSGRVLGFSCDGARLDVKESRYAPQFGQMHPARQLVLHGRVLGSSCRMGWEIKA